MRPILIMHNVNSADVMPHVGAHAANPMTSCMVHATCAHWQVRCTYVIFMCQQLLIGLVCKCAN